MKKLLMVLAIFSSLCIGGRIKQVSASISSTESSSELLKKPALISKSTIQNGYGFCLGVGPDIPGTGGKKAVNANCSSSNTWSSIATTNPNGYLLISEGLGTNPANTSNLCLAATNPLYNGADLVVYRCDLTNRSLDLMNRSWVGLSSGGIGLANTDYCLDVENGTPSLGSPIQIWTCQQLSGGLRIPAQRWTYPPNAFDAVPVTTTTTAAANPTNSFSNPWSTGSYRYIGQLAVNPWISDSTQCADLLFVGFRGSSEQPIGYSQDGEPNGTSINWGDSDFLKPPSKAPLKKGVDVQKQGVELDHLGPNLGMLYRAFSQKYPARKMGFYSVGVNEPGMPFKDIAGGIYPAVHVSLSLAADGFWKSLIRAGTDSNLNYLTQVNQIAKRCPNTQFAIAGYSQGAIAARRLALDIAKTNLSSRVSFTVFIADPLFSKSEFKFKINPETLDGDAILRTGTEQLCSNLRIDSVICGPIKSLAATYRKNFKSFLPDLYSSNMKDLRGKKGEVCMVGDLICAPSKSPKIGLISSTIAAGKEIHSSYFKRNQDWWTYVVNNLK